MTKKQIIGTVFILTIAFAAGVVLYQYWNPFSLSQVSDEGVSADCSSLAAQRDMGAGFNRMVDVLDLSEDQIVEFSEIERLYRQEMISLMEKMGRVDQQILEEVKKEDPDNEKLDDLAAVAGQIQYAIKKATANHFMEVKALCNFEQRQRFNEVISEINQFRRGRGFGNGQGAGRGGKRNGWRNR